MTKQKFWETLEESGKYKLMLESVITGREVLGDCEGDHLIENVRKMIVTICGQEDEESELLDAILNYSTLLVAREVTKRIEEDSKKISDEEKTNIAMKNTIKILKTISGLFEGGK